MTNIKRAIHRLLGSTVEYRRLDAIELHRLDAVNLRDAGPRLDA